MLADLERKVGTSYFSLLVGAINHLVDVGVIKGLQLVGLMLLRAGRKL